MSICTATCGGADRAVAMPIEPHQKNYEPKREKVSPTRIQHTTTLPSAKPLKSTDKFGPMPGNTSNLEWL